MSKKKDYLLVDGYNIIFAWDELKKLATSSLYDSRIKLLEILLNYQGMKSMEIMVVFDAHLVKSGVGSYEKFNSIHVVYTKESQTADLFIERFVAKNTKNYNIMVATSDNLEQMIILGRGAQKINAETLIRDIELNREEIKKKYTEKKPVKNNMLIDNVDQKTAEILRKMFINPNDKS